jgi:hypothetical protein
MTSARDVRPDGASGSIIAGAIAAELRAAVSEALAWLVAVPDRDTRQRPHAAGWSPGEIVGHLIDSASNNHGRFVRAALGEGLVFPTYDQNAWVSLQRYHEQDWTSLLERWVAFNEQVAVVIAQVPEAALTRAHTEHNLDRVAWRPVAVSEPATLEYFIRDYIGHLRHHIAQLAELVGPRSR